MKLREIRFVVLGWVLVASQGSAAPVPLTVKFTDFSADPRRGLVQLSAELPDTPAFDPPTSGLPTATVTLEDYLGMPGLVGSGTMAYTVDGRTIKAQIPYCRSASGNVEFMVRVTIPGKYYGDSLLFESARQALTSLPRRSSEPLSNLCAQKEVQVQPTLERINVLDIQKTNDDRHQVSVSLPLNRPTAVRLVVNGLSSNDEFPFLAHFNEKLTFTTQLAHDSQLTVYDSVSGSSLLHISLPAPTKWYWPDDDLSRFLLLMVYVVLAFIGTRVTVFYAVPLCRRWLRRVRRKWRERKGEPEVAPPVVPPKPAAISASGSEPAKQLDSTSPEPASDAKPAALQVPETAPDTMASLKDRNGALLGQLDQKDDTISALRKQLASLGVGQPVDEEPRRQTALPPKDYEDAMSAVLTDWWKSDNPDRAQLLKKIAAIGLPARFCEVANLDQSMKKASWSGPYQFLDRENGGWLWVRTPAGQVFALPADREFFKSALALQLIDQVVSGCQYDKVPVYFEEAIRACKLEAVAGDGSRYKVVGKGAISCRERARPMQDRVRPYRDFLDLPKPAVVRPGGQAWAPSSDTDSIRSIVGDEVRPVRVEIGAIRADLANLVGLVSAPGPTATPVDPLDIATKVDGLIAQRFEDLVRALKGELQRSGQGSTSGSDGGAALKAVEAKLATIGSYFETTRAVLVSLEQLLKESKLLPPAEASRASGLLSVPAPLGDQTRTGPSHAIPAPPSKTVAAQKPGPPTGGIDPGLWRGQQLRGLYSRLDAGGEYRDRLERLKAGLESEFAGKAVFEISHVGTTDGEWFDVLPADNESYVNQWFVTARRDGNDESWVFLPPGQILRHSYWLGYGKLLNIGGQKEWSECNVSAVRQPAKLRPKEGRLVVETAMDVEAGI